MMTESSHDVPPAIETALAQMPVPMALISFRSRAYLRTNRAWDALFGARRWEEIVPADDVETVRSLLQLVSEGVLEGHIRRARLLTVDGTEIWRHVCLQVIGHSDTPDLAVVVVSPAEGQDIQLPPWIGLIGSVSSFGLIVTDHDWRIEHISDDAERRLGYDRGAARGLPLLGLVQPPDAGKFLRAIDGAVTSRHATVARIRLRAADTSWRELTCIVSALCDHVPPRLAVLLTDARTESLPGASPRVEELEQHLWRIAMEVRAAGLVRDVGAAVSASRMPEAAELSGRQWEIVTRLVNGQRVPEIARSMHLSQSTVRNHLTAVYRKFGVHSQQELVALLSKAARSPE